ncbi:hypothetical protein J6590_073684 [Homalodisca vitripennis]|nr:hypothetical protein J6590_073684 [Homalodisca vitripennis]
MYAYPPFRVPEILKAHTTGARYFSNALSRAYRSYLSPNLYISTFSSNGAPGAHNHILPRLQYYVAVSLWNIAHTRICAYAFRYPPFRVPGTIMAHTARTPHFACLPKHPNHYVYLRLSLRIPSVLRSV